MWCNELRQAPQCFQGNDWQSFALLSMAYCTMRTMLIISICHQGLHCLHRSCPIVSCMYMCLSNECCTPIVCAWHAACSLSRACSKNGLYKTSTVRRYEDIFVGMLPCVSETMSSCKENNLWKALEQEGIIIITGQHLPASRPYLWNTLHYTLH